jgi:hypothetical protein
MTDNTITLKGTVDALTGFGRAVTDIGSSITSTYNYMTYSKEFGNGLERMSNGRLIELADLVHEVFRGDTLLEPPSICTIGGQSAGKSMALNSLCGLDILPNGKSIVTRTPVHLRLLHSGPEQDHIKVEFFEYSDNIGLNGNESVHKILSKYKVDLSCPQDQLYPIRKEIEKITEKYAGKSKNVVDRPINIRITSPKVPNLSIIDLPGMTHIALRDKGQPADIKENIEKMLIKYISSPRTIILAIIPATSDVEADMGLGLIKKYDPDFERTIGVLTKTDLLVDSDVERYLTNSISRDLQTKYGYFAVRNRSSEEVKNHTVEEGYGLEDRFFTSHSVYSKSDVKERMGSVNLANKLSETLISHLKACLPSVIEEIRKLDKNLEAKLDEIGRDYPQDANAKRSVMNILLSEFQKTYDQAITGRGAEYNSGAQIKRAINKMKLGCTTINPFIPEIYTNIKIKEIIEDYDGIHMSSSAISTGVIEALFQGTDEPHPFYYKSGLDSVYHPTLGNYRSNSSNSINTQIEKVYEDEDEDDDDDFTNFNLDDENEDEDNIDKNNKMDNYSNIDVRRCDPLTVLIDPYRTCMRSIQSNLINLAADILEKERFSRFPNLCNRIRDIVSNSIVPRRYQEVIADIEKRIVAEKRCVWTDNNEFNTRILPSVINSTMLKNNLKKNNKDNNQNNKDQQRSYAKLNLSGDMPINPDAIRKVLYEYFKIVKADLMTYMHKQIIAFFVTEVVFDVNTGLNDKILDKSTIEVLLEENKDKATKRAELYSLKKKIDTIKTMINDMQ